MNYEEKWNESYTNKDNYLFYPHEEVIRFVSKYIKKQTGINQFTNIYNSSQPPKVLDVGCGIGRHVKFLKEYNIDSYGIDFSSLAINEARRLTPPADNFKVASVESIPFEDNFFNFALSHGVFDSMPFEVAKKGMLEVHRCLASSGLFYVDLISGDNLSHYTEFRGEEVVKDNHEHGTVQSYFNWTKINELIQENWEIVEAFKIKRNSLLVPGFSSRYHIILKKLEIK